MRTSFLGILAWLAMVASGVGAQEPRRYTFAVVPQFPPAQVSGEWLPLLKRLGADTGLSFELKIHASIPKFESAVLRGEADFAYMNPYHAVMARHAQGFRPLVRDSKPLRGILVVRRDGPMEIAELDGKTVGFPAPNAFGASLHMRAFLAEETGIRIKPRYLDTHSNVYRHVIAGNVTAGGGVRATFESEPDAVRAQLRILHETVGVAPHTVAARTAVPDADRRKVVSALLALRDTPDGRDLLEAVRMPGVVEADYDRDYQPIEKLRIEKYIVTERK